jgi:hypothetical protein
MPRKTKSHLTKIKQFARDFGEVFSAENDNVLKTEFLFCKACQTRVVCDQRGQVRQHIDTQIHQKSLKSYDKNQQKIEVLFEKNQFTFNRDLCQFLVALNIPFHRLLDQNFKTFVEKYTKYTVPSPQTIWRNDLKEIYNSCIETIRNKLQNQFIWVSIDETMDAFGRKVANVVVGSLNIDRNQCHKFILKMEFIENTKHHQFVQSVNTALTILWPDGIKYDKVLLFLTDAASYRKLLELSYVALILN